MIRHIVMHQMKEDVSDAMLLDLKTQAEQLAAQISQIQQLEVHLNSPAADSQNFDIVLVAVFLTIADLHTYQKHPAHIAFGNRLRPLRKARACIDFEI